MGKTQDAKKETKKQEVSFEEAANAAKEKYKPKGIRWGVAHIYSSKNDTIIRCRHSLKRKQSLLRISTPLNG